MKKLMIFAKAPLKGLVKTRLKEGTSLSDDEVLTLYKAFLRDTFALAERSGCDQLIISCYPDSAIHIMKEFAGKEINTGFEVIPQHGTGFDERFTNSIRDVWRPGESIVVIGSDSPSLQPAAIDQAFNYLENKESMILGPSGEGGVYLVGIKEPLDFKGVFTKGIECENLTNLARKKDLPLYFLNEHTDLDVARDLVSFICNIPALKYAGERTSLQIPENTINALDELGLSVQESIGGKRDRELLRRIRPSQD